MKRSDMLKLIQDLFEIAPNHSNEVNAENLLSTLEDIGMSPPPDKNAGKIDGMIMCQWEFEDGF